jgi:hypothetical protein
MFNKITMGADPVDRGSKAWDCGRSLVEITCTNPSGAWVFFSWGCCVLSSIRLCVGPITLPEQSYQVWSV